MRSARFQSVLLLLAFAAALLMAVAPVVSRWLQAGQTTHAGMAMAMAEGLQAAQPAQDDPHAGHHGMHGHAHAEHGMDAAADPVKRNAPADPHAAHGDACEYCTMASRLLPWLALLLVFAPLCHRPVPLAPRTITLPASLRWPAHPVRGPPRFS